MSAVYKAIGAVSQELSAQGISKARNNAAQGYKFRGIDDVLNALSGALVKAGLVILPRCTEREVVERQTANGKAIFYVTCKVEFDLVSTEDGSKHTVCTYGEAMDSADKATNKAMSAAYKYLALLVFCIPTEASPDTDADFSTHEVKADNSQARAKWLEDRRLAIMGALNVGELKRLLDGAVATALAENDSAAVDLLNVWAEEKKSQAKPKRFPAAGPNVGDGGDRTGP